MGNNNNQRVLQGDHVHAVVLWRIYLQFVGLFNLSINCRRAAGRGGGVAAGAEMRLRPRLRLLDAGQHREAGHLLLRPQVSNTLHTAH